MIRIPQVRVVDEDGSQLGVMPTAQALAMAQERGYDLVEVAPMAAPPVVRFLDFGQFKYEATKREKEAKRKQRSVTFKEVRLKPKIATGDFDTRVRRAIQFLEEGDRLKVAVQFRGRELTHPEIGRNLLAKFSERIKDHGVVERAPLLEGKSMHITVASTHKPKVIEGPKHGGGSAPTSAETPPPAPVRRRPRQGAARQQHPASIRQEPAPKPQWRPNQRRGQSSGSSRRPGEGRPRPTSTVAKAPPQPGQSSRKPVLGQAGQAAPSHRTKAAARDPGPDAGRPPTTDSPPKRTRPAAKRAPRATRATEPEAPATATTGE